MRAKTLTQGIELLKEGNMRDNESKNSKTDAKNRTSKRRKHER